MSKCEICGSEYADYYYKNKDTGEIICEDCLLESDGVTTSTITNYFLDGEFIGDDSQSIQEVVDRLCDVFDYEQIEEG